MKRKELKNLANKIAKAELKYQSATSTEATKEAENEIIRLSGKVQNVEDMLLLDDLVQDSIKELS